MQDNGKEFLKPRDVATMFSITEETLRNWRRQGILPYFRIKNTIRFARSDILECLSRFRRDGIPGQNESAKREKKL